jgi:hypothetical protein
MNRTALGIAVAVLAAVVTMPLHEARAETEEGSAPEAAKAAVFATEQAVCAGRDAIFLAGKPGIGALSTCIAQCGGGATVSCGGTSCSATDKNCPTEGYCWSNTEGYKYCAPCQAQCTALCASGPNVTCTGNTCSATDANCASSQDGFCTSDVEGTKYCAPCPTCSAATTHCGTYFPVSCEGNYSCSFSDGCWAECDGVRTYCPGQDDSCNAY